MAFSHVIYLQLAWLVMSCSCLSLTLLEIVLSIQRERHHPIFHHSHSFDQISIHCLQCFQSSVGITVQSFIIASLSCTSLDSTTSKWWKAVYDDWGTIQSVLNMMKAPSSNHTSSIHCWSFKGLMWMLTMVRPVRPRTATHVKRQYRFKDKHRHDMTAKVCMQPEQEVKSS